MTAGDIRTILSRIYLSFSVLLFFVTNILAGMGLYKEYSRYNQEKIVYEKILELRKNSVNEINQNPHCGNNPSQLNSKCIIETLYDKEKGEYANPRTDKENIIAFEELREPEFSFVYLYWLLSFQFLLPVVLYLFRKWLIWTSNIKKVEKSEQV